MNNSVADFQAGVITRIENNNFCKASYQYIIPTVLGLLFGICTYASYNQGQIDFLSAKLYLLIASFLALFLVLFSFIAYIVCGQELNRDADNLVIYKFLDLSWSVKSIAINAAFIFIAWIPYLLQSYPGIYWWDTTLQITQVETSPMVLWNQHPFADTLLFGLFARIGSHIFGNIFAGLFILIVLQSIIASAAFAAVVSYVSKYSVGKRWQLALLFYFAFCPLFPRMYGTLVKDTIFSPLFTIFVLMFCELMRNKGENLHNVRFCVPFVLVAIGVSLSKSTGSLIVLGSMLLLVFAKFRPQLKTACACIGIAVFAINSLSVPVASRFITIEPGRKQESLALPLQQVANAAIHEPDTFTQSEKDYLNVFYATDFNGLASAYKYTAADPIKDPVQMTQPLVFIKIWLKHSLINPQSYVSAFAGLGTGWFAFPVAEDWSSNGGGDADIPTDSQWHYQGVEALSGWDQFTIGSHILSYMDKVFAEIPILNIIFVKALWASILPFVVVFIISIRKRGQRLHMLVWMGPMLLSVLSLYVCPTSIYQDAVRYIFPIVSTIPLFLIIASKASLDNE